MIKYFLLSASLLAIYYVYSQNNAKIDKVDLNATYKEFQSFKSTYKPEYKNLEEEAYRFKIFQQNLQLINEHNSSQSDYVLGVNFLADLTWDEIKEKYLTKLFTDDTICDNDLDLNNSDDDVRKIDWNDLGKVSGVKNQKQCGSCWAFSAIGSIESLYAIKKNENIELSPQQLVDCSRDYNNHGCAGGMIGRALKYASEHSLATEKNYPYEGHSRQCKTDIDFKYKINGCARVTATTTGLVETLKQQPVSVAMSVDLTFAFYRFGVYNPWRCGHNVNHAMLAVGFDLDHKTPYFHIKNSWGKLWGWFGYAKVAIGKTESGTCNIAGSGHNFVPILNE